MLCRIALLSILVTSLAACFPSVRPGVQRDSAPRIAIDVSNIPEVVPQPEEILRTGNISPYTVLGGTYEVMPTSRGYRETGYASWYGSKFHGRLTSNGEVYDMYQITAAHKTLPIPAYVLVRNLENGKELIVRVNDRGPFHGDRIIDLSWAAASKLGYADTGVARVEVIALDPNNYQITLAQLAAENNPHVSQSSMPADSQRLDELSEQDLTRTHLQIAAFSSLGSAQELAQQVTSISTVLVEVVAPFQDGDLYRVVAGPLANNAEFEVLRTLLELNGLPAGYPVNFEEDLLVNCSGNSDSPIC